MVGLPAKNGGCHTCRRRKVKCDRGKPHCERCIRVGRQCEGYESYAVFLNRTPNGLQRRKRLEEALIPSSTTSGTRSSPDWETSSDDEVKQHAVTKFRPLSTSPTVSLSSLTSNNLLVPELEHRQIYELFVRGFFSKLVPTVKYQVTRHWLQIVSNFKSPGRALSVSLKALAYGHVGLVYQDPHLMFKGREFYCSALRELQKILHTASDTALGACKGLAMYEMLVETADQDPMSKMGNHQRGMESLIIHRGPGEKDSELFNCLLENARESSVSLALLEGRYTLFERPEWMSNRTDFSSRMIHMGATVANIYYDVLQAERTKSLTDRTVHKVLQRCFELSVSLNSWWQDFSGSHGLQLYWEDQSLSATSSSREPLPYSFNTFQDADLLTKYWVGVILILLVPKMLRNALGHDAFPPNSRIVVDEVHQALGRPDLRETARHILRSIPYFLQEDMGVHGANRVTFAFRMAIPILKNDNFEFNAIEREWVDRLTRCFVTLKGIPFHNVQAKCFF